MMISIVSIRACFLLLCMMSVSADLMGASLDGSSLQGSLHSNEYTSGKMDTPPFNDNQEESSETNGYENEDETPKNHINKRDLLRNKVIDLMKRKFHAMRGKKNSFDYVKRKFYATRGKKDDTYSKRKFYATRGKKDNGDYIAKRQFYATRGKKDNDGYDIKREFNAMRGKRNLYSLDSEYPISRTWNLEQPTNEGRVYIPLKREHERY